MMLAASVYNLVQFAPGVRDGVAKLIVSGTTSAYARGSLYNGAQGATYVHPPSSLPLLSRS